jgi:AraC family transcriptional regulator, glycine betaine-responsive activator
MRNAKRVIRYAQSRMPALFSPAESRPYQIDVLVLPDFSLMSLAATVEPLRAANRASAQDLYHWRLLSPDGAPPSSSSGIPVLMHDRFEPEAPRDVLFVVAAFHARHHAKPLLRDLRGVVRRGVPVGGIESGSWALAMAGLLDGYRATTHWEDLEEFAAAFPRVDVVSDRYVIDRGRFTAGGAAPALDMMLNMVRAQHGLTLALDAASLFIYDQKQLAEEPQSIVSVGRLATIDPELARAIHCMQAHMEAPLPTAAIARRVGLSVRTLQLRFRARLGVSPYEYYLDLRLAAARRMLQQTSNSAAEVAVAHGFGSGSAFARAFRQRYGVSPAAARRQAAESAPLLTGRPPVMPQSPQQRA